jgi:hypothetical protein
MTDVNDSLDLTLGVTEIGTFIGTLLYGMILLQCYIYVMSCREDRIWLKVFVFFVLCVSRVSSVLVSH